MSFFVISFFKVEQESLALVVVQQPSMSRRCLYCADLKC